MANLKWKDSESLKESMYDSIILQAKDDLLLSVQAAGFFVIWIFPMLGYIGEASTGTGNVLKAMCLLFLAIALFIVGFQAIPYLKIRKKDFDWLYTEVESIEKHQVICGNGLACDSSGTKYKTGTKVVVLQISGKNFIFSREIKNKRKTKKKT